MTAPIRLLNAGRLPQPLLARLAAHYELHTLAEQPDRAGFLAAHGADFAAMVTSADPPDWRTPCSETPWLANTAATEPSTPGRSATRRCTCYRVCAAPTGWTGRSA